MDKQTVKTIAIVVIGIALFLGVQYLGSHLRLSWVAPTPAVPVKPEPAPPQPKPKPAFPSSGLTGRPAPHA